MLKLLIKYSKFKIWTLSLGKMWNVILLNERITWLNPILFWNPRSWEFGCVLVLVRLHVILMRLHVEEGVKDICFAWVKGRHFVCGLSLKKIGTKFKKKLARSLRAGYVLGWKKSCVFAIWSSSHEVHEGFCVRFGTMLKFMWFWGSAFCAFLFFFFVCVRIFFCNKWSKVVGRFMYFYDLIWNKVVRFVRFCNIEICEVL